MNINAKVARIAFLLVSLVSAIMSSGAADNW
jgi:hypothetical protein